MLQIRSVRPKYDKASGNQTGNTLSLSTTKFAWDGKHARKINVCDHTGAVLPSGVVSPGDVVAATIYAKIRLTQVSVAISSASTGALRMLASCANARSSS
eukprot:4187660-Prymnesium_polylepis.1